MTSVSVVLVHADTDRATKASPESSNDAIMAAGHGTLASKPRQWQAMPSAAMNQELIAALLAARNPRATFIGWRASLSMACASKNIFFPWLANPIPSSAISCPAELYTPSPSRLVDLVHGELLLGGLEQADERRCEVAQDGDE